MQLWRAYCILKRTRGFSSADASANANAHQETVPAAGAVILGSDEVRVSCCAFTYAAKLLQGAQMMWWQQCTPCSCAAKGHSCQYRVAAAWDWYSDGFGVALHTLQVLPSLVPSLQHCPSATGVQLPRQHQHQQSRQVPSTTSPSLCLQMSLTPSSNHHSTHLMGPCLG